ncbi:MAG TPA: hypothetical protein VGP26_28260 [Actinophytocola sp.]|jgi:hypothetical protein|nr:hypothetical protein [Actinophytocola sp.]
MTVENDGVPLREGAVDEAGEKAPDPATELLPLDAAAATRAAADDAAARQAQLDGLAPPPAGDAAAEAPDTPTHGSMEGDLFDDQPDQNPPRT